MTAARKFVSSDRLAMLAKVHLAAKELGLGEDARRDVLERVTGHRSSADCTDTQLDEVLAEFRRLGWTPKIVQGGKPARAPASRRAPADHPVARKARALWISLWHLGVVENRSELALEAFAKRQLKVATLQWADQGKSEALLKALKAMAERAGWSQDLALVKPARHVWSLKARLVQRQAEILGRPALKLHDATEAQLDKLAQAMGVEIRAAKDSAG